jgi:hypothetical protein
LKCGNDVSEQNIELLKGDKDLFSSLDEKSKLELIKTRQEESKRRITSI